MKKKSKIIMAAVIIGISIAILLWSLSPPETESVSDLVNNPDDFIGKSIQIKGVVQNDTIVNGTNSVTFNLTDESDRMVNLSIFYEGSAPNNFQGGKTVFIKGTLDRDDEDNLVFEAEKIVVGCPSKYE